MAYRIAVLILLISVTIFPQEDTHVTLELNGCTITADYDTLNFCSDLVVRAKDKNIIHSEECIERVTALNAEDLDADGKKELLIERYSGGAHCCTSLYIGTISGGKFRYIDSVYLGNCSYYIDDIGKDGRKEIISCNDMFAYFFTNFAQSRLPVVIYKLVKGKLKIVNMDFTSIVMKDVKELKKELGEYMKTGYECPKQVEGKYEVFNTDAGAVQALLAAIAANYCSIGENEKGFEYINKVYKCPDKKNFIKVLKTDFKLK